MIKAAGRLIGEKTGRPDLLGFNLVFMKRMTPAILPFDKLKRP
jgi:hypothetical protein